MKIALDETREATPEKTIRFQCAHCQQPIEVPQSMEGDGLVCPGCQRTARVPTAAATQPPGVPWTEAEGILATVIGVATLAWFVAGANTGYWSEFTVAYGIFIMLASACAGKQTWSMVGGFLAVVGAVLMLRK